MGKYTSQPVLQKSYHHCQRISQALPQGLIIQTLKSTRALGWGAGNKAT